MPSSQTPPAGSTAVDPTAVRPPIDDARIVRTTPDALRAELLALKNDGFAMLLDVGGVDYLERTPRFDVVYHLLRGMTAARPERVRVLCGVDGPEPVLPTVSDLWPSANWAEREVYDLFGVVFSGHPDLRRIQLPADWAGYPLRKDYPLRGPALERTPRPSFALKSNVAAGTPVFGKTAAALQRQIVAARAAAADGAESIAAGQSASEPGAAKTAGGASTAELAREQNTARGGQLPKDGAK
jgi:NADH-quinone oxidoreductase subunit C